MQLDSKTIGKLAVFASGYVALLWVLIEYLDLSATRSVTGIGALVPAVVVLAFLFETMDSAAGMGFGTALSPLLLALGYDPLAVAPALLVSESLTGFIAGSMHNEFRNAEFSFEWPPNEATKLVSLIAGIGVTAVIGSVVLTYLALSLPDSLIKTYVAILVIVMGIIGIVRQYIQPTADYRPKQMIAFAALAGFNKGIGGGGYGPVVTLGELYSGVYEKRCSCNYFISRRIRLNRWYHRVLDHLCCRYSAKFRTTAFTACWQPSSWGHRAIPSARVPESTIQVRDPDVCVPHWVARVREALPLLNLNFLAVHHQLR